MKLDSIRWRLVLSYVLLTILAVGLVGVLTLTLLQEYVRSQTQAQLQDNASAIARQAYALMVPVQRQPALQDLVNSVAFLGHVRVRILDPNAHILADSGQPGSSTSLIWEQPDAVHPSGRAFLVPLPSHQTQPGFNPLWQRGNDRQRSAIIMRVEEAPWGRRVVFESVTNATASPARTADPTPTVAVHSRNSNSAALASLRYPIGNPANPLGYVQLDLADSPGGQALEAMRQALLLAGLGAAAIAVVAGLLVGRSLTAPLLALAESATRMSSGDLAVRAPEGGLGEIGQLSYQFNRMAERLQASFTAISTERDALRRFIADASHEMRTPITALRNFIELMQGPAAADAPAQEEFLAESHQQVQRLEWITQNLLDLSRMDAGLI